MNYSQIKQLVEKSVQGAMRNLLKRQSLKRKDPLIRRLRFRQSNGDMPSNGAYFDSIYAVDESYQLYKVSITGAGTYTVQLEYDGSMVGDQFTNASDYPFIFAPITWKSGKAVRLKVISSESCSQFEAVFSCKVI